MAAKLLTTEEKNYLRSIYLTFMIGTDAVRTYFDQLHPPTDLVAHLANNKSASSPTSAEFDITILICLLREMTPKVVAPTYTSFDQLPDIAEKSPETCLANIKFYRNFLGHPDKVKLRTLSCTTFDDLFTRVGMAISVLGNNQLCGKVAVAKQLNIDNDFAEYLEKFVKHEKQLEDLHEGVQQISKRINHLQISCDKSEDKSDELENELRCLEEEIEKKISDITSNSKLCKQLIETIEKNVKDIGKQLIQTNATQTRHGKQILNLEQGLDSLSKQQGDNSEKIKKLNEQKLSIKGLHQNIVQKWRSRIVYKTEAMKRVLDLLNTNKAVTVIGPHGIGKTTSLHCVALKMEEQGYELVPAQSARDILQLYEHTTKQLFIFDDVCGKGVLQKHLLDAWHSSLDMISDILKKDNVRLLVSCQSSVYRNPSFKNISILTKCTHMLEALSKSEKREIAVLYMSESEANTLLEEDHIHEGLDFPLLCNMYQRNTKLIENSLQNIDVKTFFSNNVDVIKSQLESLMKADDQCMFAVLMLFVFCNNHIDVELISMMFEYTEILKYILAHITYFIEIEHPCYLDLDRGKERYLISDIYEIIDILEKISKKMSLGRRLREIYKKCKQSELPKSVLRKELRALKEVFLKHVEEKATIYHNGAVYMLEIILSEKLHFEQVIDVFSQEFKLPFLLSKNKIQEILCSLTDSYVSKGQSDTSGFTVLNNKIFDILVLVCGENLNNLILTHGHSKIIRDKVIMPSSSDNDCFFRIQTDSDYSYFDRLVYDICNGDLEYVFENSQLKDEQIGISFAKYLQENLDAKTALVSFKESDSYYPLHIAAREGLTSIVVVLLEDFQLDVKSKDYENVTLLIEAVRGGHYDTSLLLLEKGICCNTILNEVFNGGDTPLSTSLEKGYTEIFELLLKHGADPDIGTEEKSLMHMAVTNDQIDIVELLLNYKADPDAGQWRWEHGEVIDYSTPLITAVEKKNVKITEVLLCHDSNPVNPNYYNSFGETSLHIAAEKGYLEIVKLLLKYFADPSITTGDGYTADSLAQAGGHHDIVKVLREHNNNDEIPKYAETPNKEKIHKTKFYQDMKDRREKMTKKANALISQRKLDMQTYSPEQVSS